MYIIHIEYYLFNISYIFNYILSYIIMYSEYYTHCIFNFFYCLLYFCILSKVSVFSKFFQNFQYFLLFPFKYVFSR